MQEMRDLFERAPTHPPSDGDTQLSPLDAGQAGGAVISFRTAFIPEESSVYESVNAFVRGEPGLSLRYALEQFDVRLKFGCVRLEHAMDRVPLIWDGIEQHWAPDPGRRRDALEEAVQRFLVMANLNALLALGAVRFAEDPALPDGLLVSSQRHKNFQKPQVAEALQASGPFWAADMSIGGHPLDVFAPKHVLSRALERERSRLISHQLCHPTTGGDPDRHKNAGRIRPSQHLHPQVARRGFRGSRLRVSVLDTRRSELGCSLGAPPACLSEGRGTCRERYPTAPSRPSACLAAPSGEGPIVTAHRCYRSLARGVRFRRRRRLKFERLSDALQNGAVCC